MPRIKSLTTKEDVGPGREWEIDKIIEVLSSSEGNILELLTKKLKPDVT